jgi:phage-related protein
MSAQIYRQAAQLVSSGKEDYACHAIESVVGLKSAEERLFARYFKPRNFKPGNIDVGWFGLPIGENQVERETALLLMAEIAEDL